ncbi:MAG: hypothetical protein ABIP35_15270 [Ginsengibacter sp.]
MIFKLFPDQQDELKLVPETGMGYQLIQARFKGEYTLKEFIVLNEELVVENNYQKKDYLKEIFLKGFNLSLRNAVYRELKEIKLINEIKSFNVFGESGGHSSSTKESLVIYPDGKSYHVRLSASDADKRIDKKNNCLLPGSYTTTKRDYEKCVNDGDNPVERYALPNEEKIEWAFHIFPQVKDSYQFGIVKPDFGKRGGGEECFFENGTSFGTFKKQTDYGIFYP